MTHSPTPSLPQNEPGWSTFTTSNGLGSNAVTNVIQDNQGILWFATYPNGFTLFDGTNWEIHSDFLGKRWVLGSASDKHGNLWFATNEGAFKYNGTAWQSFNLENTNKGLPGTRIRAILADDQDNIWFASAGYIRVAGGQRSIPIEYGVTRYNGHDWVNLPDKVGVSTIFQDRDGNLWFGTNAGVTRYDGSQWQTFTTKDGLANDYITAIIQDNQGNMWFGTDSGVSRYDGKIWRTFTREDGLVGNAIDYMLEDNTGILWFGAYSLNGYGISSYNGKRWQNFNPWQGLGEYNVYSIFQDKEGTLWFGTELGLARYKPN